MAILGYYGNHIILTNAKTMESFSSSDGFIENIFEGPLDV
jgi:hypothetical protein